jgi:hypothetical protein
MNSYSRVRHAIGFGNLWKTAADIQVETGIDRNEVVAELDAIRMVHGVSVKATDAGYAYAMTARIPA